MQDYEVKFIYFKDRTCGERRCIVKAHHVLDALDKAMAETGLSLEHIMQSEVRSL
jgi:hypothetical protein